MANELSIRVSKTTVARLLAAMIAALFVLNVFAVLFEFVTDDFTGRDYYIQFFRFNGEGKVPTFYSAVALLACSVVLAVIARAKRARGEPFVAHWTLLSLIFLFLSLDEATMVHEQMTKPLRRLLGIGNSGPLFYAWVIPGMAFVAVLGLAYLRFLARLEQRTRRLFVASAVLFLTGALVLEMVGAAYVRANGRVVSYGALTALEETLEMVGVAVFLYALLEYLERDSGSVRFELN